MTTTHQNLIRPFTDSFLLRNSESPETCRTLFHPFSFLASSLVICRVGLDFSQKGQGYGMSYDSIINLEQEA